MALVTSEGNAFGVQALSMLFRLLHVRRYPSTAQTLAELHIVQKVQGSRGHHHPTDSAPPPTQQAPTTQHPHTTPHPRPTTRHPPPTNSPPPIPHHPLLTIKEGDFRRLVTSEEKPIMEAWDYDYWNTTLHPSVTLYFGFLRLAPTTTKSSSTNSENKPAGEKRCEIIPLASQLALHLLRKRPKSAFVPMLGGQSQPVSQPFSQPVSQSASQPVSQSVRQSISQSVSQSINQY